MSQPRGRNLAAAVMRSVVQQERLHLRVLTRFARSTTGDRPASAFVSAGFSSGTLTGGRVGRAATVSIPPFTGST